MKEPEHKPVDSPLYWLIPSNSDPDSNYLIYLGANGGYGRCSCTWGRAEVDKAFKEGRQPMHMCEHLKEAHRRFHKWSIYQFVLKNPNHQQDENNERS